MEGWTRRQVSGEFGLGTTAHRVGVTYVKFVVFTA